MGSSQNSTSCLSNPWPSLLPAWKSVLLYNDAIRPSSFFMWILCRCCQIDLKQSFPSSYISYRFISPLNVFKLLSETSSCNLQWNPKQLCWWQHLLFFHRELPILFRTVSTRVCTVSLSPRAASPSYHRLHMFFQIRFCMPGGGFSSDNISPRSCPKLISTIACGSKFGSAPWSASAQPSAFPFHKTDLKNDVFSLWKGSFMVATCPPGRLALFFCFLLCPLLSILPDLFNGN